MRRLCFVPKYFCGRRVGIPGPCSKEMVSVPCCGDPPPQPKYLKVRKQQFCEWAEEIWLLAVLGIVFSEASVSYPLTVEPGGGVQPRLPCGCCEVLSASFVPQVNPVRLVVLGVFCGWWNRCREFNSLIQGHRMVIGCTRVQTQVWVLVHVLSRWPCLW